MAPSVPATEDSPSLSTERPPGDFIPMEFLEPGQGLG